MSTRPDFSWAGPVLDCPGCKSTLFQTVIVMDPETQLPGMYGLDAVCVGCRAKVKLACPMDELVMEAPVEVTDEDD
jgi:hypothetical protein